MIVVFNLPSHHFCYCYIVVIIITSIIVIMIVIIIIMSDRRIVFVKLLLTCRTDIRHYICIYRIWCQMSWQFVPDMSSAQMYFRNAAQSSGKNTSPKPQTSKNSFGPVKICDGQVKFKHNYRETWVWNSDSGYKCFLLRLTASSSIWSMATSTKIIFQ